MRAQSCATDARGCATHTQGGAPGHAQDMLRRTPLLPHTPLYYCATGAEHLSCDRRLKWRGTHVMSFDTHVRQPSDVVLHTPDVHVRVWKSSGLCPMPCAAVYLRWKPPAASPATSVMCKPLWTSTLSFCPQMARRCWLRRRCSCGPPCHFRRSCASSASARTTLALRTPSFFWWSGYVSGDGQRAGGIAGAHLVRGQR